MKLTPRTAQVHIRISPELKEAAENAAATERPTPRTLSALIEVLLVEYLERRQKQDGRR